MPHPTDMRIYNNPNTDPSSVGTQFRTDFYWKKALVEARKEQYFTQLADVKSMPKNMGKTIKRYHYIPLLDDENINDQGIDANGVTILSTTWEAVLKRAVDTFTVEADATAAAAAVNAVDSGSAVKAGSGPWTVTYSNLFLVGTEAEALAIKAAVPGATIKQRSGNLYGSSKDAGFIPAKLPVLSETGGRVNRVGFKRKDLEGSIEKFGFFEEYTQESMDFDTDAELRMHVNREMLNGATQLTEAALQTDLLNSAGVIRYAGEATEDKEIDEDCLVTYGDLLRLSIDLDNNRTPKHTKVITGTRYIDTKTIPAARVMYVGSELLPHLHSMKDLHNEKAFIPVQHYAAGGTVLNGEEGTIGHFRVVVPPEMQRWAGAGAELGGEEGFYSDGENFDVLPMLVVGDESFTTIGFQTDGKMVKFKIIHKKPGEGVADRFDPYGETGFMSIKWYYGFMLLRPERIGLIKTAGIL